MHGDQNGLISVPACDGEQLVRAVDSVRAREQKLMNFVRGPEFSLETLSERFLE